MPKVDETHIIALKGRICKHQIRPVRRRIRHFRPKHKSVTCFPVLFLPADRQPTILCCLCCKLLSFWQCWLQELLHRRFKVVLDQRERGLGFPFILREKMGTKSTWQVGRSAGRQAGRSSSSSKRSISATRPKVVYYDQGAS